MPIKRSALEQIQSSFKTTTGEAVIETMADWGIQYVFGIPGDNVNGLLDGLIKQKDRAKFVLVRHEENAAFMATGYYKASGKMAACLATSGPGAFHLINGMAEALHDMIPMLALTGNTDTGTYGTVQVQEFHPEKDFASFSVWSHLMAGTMNARILTSMAIRAALAKSGPALLSVPVDIGLMPLPKDAPPADTQFAVPTLEPDPQLIARVVELIDQAKRPVLLVGRGCRGLDRELIRLAETIGAPIIKALWGKDAVSDFDPHVLGGLGYLGTRASVEAVAGCDLLLMLGTSFPYVDFLPEPGAVTTIQIDQDPYQIGKRYAVSLGVCADLRKAVPMIVERCRRQEDRSWIQSMQQARAQWLQLMDKQARDPRTPMRPQAMVHALQACAKEDAILTLDSGSSTAWMARNFMTTGHQRMIGSGLMATMQCSLPYAIGAQFARPDKQVLCTTGDGALMMCLGEFMTAVQYQLPIVVTVFNNAKLAFIKYEEQVAGVPEFGIHFPNPDFVKFAEACGAFGVRVEDPRDAQEAVRAAIASGKPALIDAIVEPNEVPFPPKVQEGQAIGFGIALLREQFARIRE
jgi:pyruvate oxidase